jgi:hypothetical protein
MGRAWQCAAPIRLVGPGVSRSRPPRLRLVRHVAAATDVEMQAEILRTLAAAAFLQRWLDRFTVTRRITVPSTF